MSTNPHPLFSELTKAALDQVTSGIKTLAQSGEDLYNARQHLGTLQSSLESIDQMRDAAKGLKDLYAQLPWLQAVTLSISHSTETSDEGRGELNYAVTVDGIEVSPGRLLDASTLQDQLETALASCVIVDGDHLDKFNPPYALSGNPACLYNSLDSHGDAFGDELSITTSRAALDEFSSQPPSLELAEFLFPNTWRLAAERLGLPVHAPEKPTFVRERNRSGA